MMSGIRIIVVGAGLAGLATAYALKNLGLATTVLEARSRVGGRVWSTRLANGAIAELGGEWIWSEDTEVLRLANELDLELVRTGLNFRIRTVVNGPVVSAEEQKLAHQTASEALAALTPVKLSQLTIGEFLERLPLREPQRKLLFSRLQGSFGIDLYHVALRMIGEYSLGQGGEYFRFLEGNQSLAEALASQLDDVRLGYRVEKINHYPEGVSAAGRLENEFTEAADAAVIAIPASLMPRLTFHPPLPELSWKAISSIQTAQAAKLAVATNLDPPLVAVQDVSVPFWAWTGMGRDGVTRPVITSFCGSSAAVNRLAGTRGDPSRWLSRLKSAVPSVEMMNDTIMVNWSQQEFSGGCYSAFDNPSAELSPYLSQPVGRLFFAGEYTDEDSGTMQGALASGLRSARQIHEVFS